MQLKKQLKRAARLQFYNRRAFTMPLFPTISARRQPSTKTIRSLNFYCLAEIFEYLEYSDLINCRLVCSYWKDCIDFHLGRRTHLAYGKQFNNLPPRKVHRKKNSLFTTNVLLNPETYYSCEKCRELNEKNSDDGKQQQQQLRYINRSSKSPSPMFDELSSSSRSLSSISMYTSPSVSPINTNYDSYELRCFDCQQMLKELREQIEQQIKNDDEIDTSEDEADFYSGYIDCINMSMLESILARMPRLTTLKFAQG